MGVKCRLRWQPAEKPGKQDATYLLPLEPELKDPDPWETTNWTPQSNANMPNDNSIRFSFRKNGANTSTWAE
jgi:hypothetical protein